MENRIINLFIVADNALVVNGLKHYLNKRFGTTICISNFYNKKSCLKKVNKNTQVVVLDYLENDKSVLETFKKIRTINPVTEIILPSSNEDIANSIDAFQKKRSNWFGEKYIYKLVAG